MCRARVGHLFLAATGVLWRIDPSSGDYAAVDLGGAALTNGDGLLLGGERTLLAVQNRLNRTAVVRLDRDYESGRVVGAITDPDFDVPTTVTLKRGSLYLPNAAPDAGDRVLGHSGRERSLAAPRQAGRLRGDNQLVRLESVRDLKKELTQEDGEALDLGAAGEGVVALGVAPPAGADGYRLAVRVQRGEAGAGVLARIERAARGEVDVRHVGRVVAQSEPDDRRERPVGLGASVGHFAITAGSVGAFVRVEQDERARLLSNNHVLANENRGSPGDEILQPGPADGGRRGADRIGVLERFVELDPAGVNEVDAALARLDDSIGFVNEVAGEPVGEQPAAAEEVDAVIKQGRTTGLTRGRVSAIEVDGVAVSFSAGTLRFDDQIEISGAGQAFSAGGDSGSLILEDATNRGVALLFAGSEQGGPGGSGLTYGNPLSTVFARLRVARLA